MGAALVAAFAIHAALLATQPGLRSARFEARSERERALLVEVAVVAAASATAALPAADAPAPTLASPRGHLPRRTTSSPQPLRATQAPAEFSSASRDVHPASVATTPAATAGTAPAHVAGDDVATVGQGGHAAGHSLTPGGSGSAGAQHDGEGAMPTARPARAATDSAALLDALMARVRAHRHYPELARRRGIEGIVGVRFVSRGDGSAEVSVVRSADPLLDDAARAAVLAAGPFPALAGPREIDVAFLLTDD